jgi:O-methyltransferase
MNQLLRRVWRNWTPKPLQTAIIGVLTRGNCLPRLIYGKATYNHDGLLTVHNADFMLDPQFAQAYAAGKSTGSWRAGDLQWRIHVLCWAAHKALGLEGDFVECGVNRGGNAQAIIHYVDFARLPRTFYLLDTFSGLVESQITDEERTHGIETGVYEECYDAVVRTFSPSPNVKIIRGMVPETLPQVTSEKIAFLSIDMNVREPEIAAAEYFWDKLVSGAVIVLDDYGWRKHIEQKRAFDDFARQRGVQVLSLPTGQGLIIKP